MGRECQDSCLGRVAGKLQACNLNPLPELIQVLGSSGWERGQNCAHWRPRESSDCHGVTGLEERKGRGYLEGSWSKGRRAAKEFCDSDQEAPGNICQQPGRKELFLRVGWQRVGRRIRDGVRLGGWGWGREKKWRRPCSPFLPPWPPHLPARPCAPWLVAALPTPRHSGGGDEKGERGGGG